ncbi:MAG: hypothetical protein IIY06_04525 [Proteobacteria bacterium]|nr:hypothetical protein [Pseudomonadota bacterium]
MRKCPNCKKAIPVGAKKCIHCRASVVDYEGQDGSWDNETVRNNTTAFARPNSGNSLNPIDGGGRGYGSGGRMGSSSSYDRISGVSGHISSSGGYGRISGGYNTPLSGSYGRANGGYGRANSYNSYEDTPHNTMLGLGPIAAPGGRDFYDEEKSSGNRGSNTIAGMPGIKFDMSRRQAMEQDAQIPSGSSMPTPEASAPVPKPLDISSSKPVSQKDDFDPLAGLSGVAPSAPKDDVDPFAGLPGVAPAPSSLVDEEFDDLTAKLFGDEFAAGGNDVGDEEGFDFDFTEEPEEKPAETKPVESEKSVEEILNTSNPLGIKPKDEKPKEKEETKPKAETKPTTETHVEPAKENKVAKKEPSVLDKVAPIASIVAAVLSIVWLFVLPDGDKSLGFPIVASVLAIGVDGASIKIAPKLKNVGMLVAFLVCAVLLFVAMANIPASAARNLMTCASVAQLVCGIIYYCRKY